MSEDKFKTERWGEGARGEPDRRESTRRATQPLLNFTIDNAGPGLPPSLISKHCTGQTKPIYASSLPV